MRRTLHPGSLLRIPFVRHLTSEPRLRYLKRRVDGDWWWVGKLAMPEVGGFRPFCGELCVPRRSVLAAWLRRPGVDGRLLNRADVLVKQVAMLVHDYLHVWAYSRLRELVPELALGYTPPSK